LFIEAIIKKDKKLIRELAQNIHVRKFIPKCLVSDEFLKDDEKFHIKDPWIIDLLVELGADVRAMDVRGNNLIGHLLVFDYPLDVIKHVVEKYDFNVSDVNHRNYVGNTPLHIAITYNGGGTGEALEAVDYLLYRGANPLEDNDDGDTPRMSLEKYSYYDSYTLPEEIAMDKKIAESLRDLEEVYLQMEKVSEQLRLQEAYEEVQGQQRLEEAYREVQEQRGLEEAYREVEEQRGLEEAYNSPRRSPRRNLVDEFEEMYGPPRTGRNDDDPLRAPTRYVPDNLEEKEPPVPPVQDELAQRELDRNRLVMETVDRVGRVKQSGFDTGTRLIRDPEADRRVAEIMRRLRGIKLRPKL
jgi:hypothetical protein